MNPILQIIWAISLLTLTIYTALKLSQIKSSVADAAAKSTEAFAELATRIGDLQKQVDDLIAGNADPDVTDEAFTANLATLKEKTDALADIVPTPVA